VNVVVTGASRGLGAALARRLAAPGVLLGLTGRDAAALAAVAADCRARGAATRTAALDVRDAAGMAALLAEWDAAAPLDLAIANAGIAHGTRPDGSAEGPAAFRAQVETNLLGAAHLAEPLWPAMRARGRGQIVFVASLAAFRGLPDSPGYCASKAGLWAYGEALRAALAPHGVAVTLVAPGFFESGMGRRWVGARPLQLSAEAAAERIARAVARRAARLDFPAPLGWALRLAPLLPARWVDAAVRRLAFGIREGG
jgi:short-subunit dehydrogenase